MGWKKSKEVQVCVKKTQKEAFGEGMTNRRPPRAVRLLVVLVVLLLVGAVTAAEVWCESSRDCTDDGAAECNLTGHTCGRCTSDAACDNRVHGTRVRCVAGRCNHTTCTDAVGSCPSPHAYVCDLATHVCGQCTDDAQCAPLRFCDRRAASATRGSCFACEDDLDCAGATPHCAAGTCVACASDAMCAARGLNRTCDIDARSPLHGHCVECLASRACASDAAAHCAADQGVCVACTADADCAAGHGANTVCDTNATSLTRGHCVRALGAARPLAPALAPVLVVLFLTILLS